MLDDKIGKYRILELVGRGGMGIIFKAHDLVLDRLVAVKVISPEIEVTDELRARFFREAQACAKLNHPNIVTVYDLGEDNGRLFIVMELLEGQELRRLISQGPPLTLEDKLSVMVQVCGGLHYAHQKGIVHRDMKPGNVFLLATGRVKILDFGIAHMTSSEPGLTRTGLIMGTLRYISPEQVKGRADHRSDIFSVGSVFYELLTSRQAFAGDDPMRLLEQLRTENPPPASAVDPSIPPAVTAIVERAMRKDPSERFRDLDEMRVELEQVQRAVSEERSRASARVRDHRQRLLRLQGQLDERLGAPGEYDETPTLEERKSVVALQALEQTLIARIGDLEERIAEAATVEPAMQRAHALLEAGRFGEAAAHFEAVVARVPAHQRARQGLERARAAQDVLRRDRQDARQDPTVVALTTTPAETTSSPVAPRIENHTTEPIRMTAPERSAWEAPGPWRGKLPAIVAGLVGVAAIIAAAAVYWRPPAPKPPTALGGKENVAAVGSEPAKPILPPSALESGGREKTVAMGAEPRAVPELPPRPADRSGRAVSTAKTDGAPRPHPVEAARSEPPRSTPGNRQDVNKLAGRVAGARRAAEQAAAGYWAPQPWTSARNKEQLAGTELARSDYERALKLLAEAESEYQIAGERAKAEAETEHKRAPLEERVGDARASTSAQRAAAVAAQAARLAKDLFEAADVTHHEADDLDRRQDFAGAAKAYEAASAQYRQAARRAQAARESRPGEGTRVP